MKASGLIFIRASAAIAKEFLKLLELKLEGLRNLRRDFWNGEREEVKADVKKEGIFMNS